MSRTAVFDLVTLVLHVLILQTVPWYPFLGGGGVTLNNSVIFVKANFGSQVQGSDTTAVIEESSVDPE